MYIFSKTWWKICGIKDVPLALGYLWRGFLWRIGTWWFWYSPIWSQTRRCPACAGSGTGCKYGDVYECSMCQGTGKTNNWKREWLIDDIRKISNGTALYAVASQPLNKTFAQTVVKLKNWKRYLT